MLVYIPVFFSLLHTQTLPNFEVRKALGSYLDQLQPTLFKSEGRRLK